MLYAAEFKALLRCFDFLIFFGGWQCSLLLALPPPQRKMDVSADIWECLFDAKAKRWLRTYSSLSGAKRPFESDVTVFNSDQYQLVRIKSERQN
jgi:hypothetical protein